MWILAIVAYYLMMALTTTTVGQAARLPDIYWNASNPVFRIDNTDHIIDVNRGNNPFEYDQVNLVCPTYPKGTRSEDTESYIIYNVSKEEYESCSITNNNARIIAVCDKPHQVMYFTITFRSFTPQPGGLEFKPGNDYYFVSTSTGSPRGVHQKFGGRCATHNMKIIFKVAPPLTGGASASAANSSIPAPQSTAATATGPAPSVEGASMATSVATANGSQSLPSQGAPAMPAPSSTILKALMPGAAGVTGAGSSSLPSKPLGPVGARPGWTSSGNVGKPLVPPAGSPLSGGHHPPPPMAKNLTAVLLDHRSPTLAVTTSPRASNELSTPYWWRLPSTTDRTRKGSGVRAAVAADGGSGNDGAGGGKEDSGPRKSAAWILLIGSGLAIGLACLIISALFGLMQTASAASRIRQRKHLPPEQRFTMPITISTELY